MGLNDASKPHYLGHRERLRRRFCEAGPDALPDYQLLEPILFRAAPRRDTKPLAKALIARFGTFAEALNAPEELLREIPGVGEAAVTELKLVRAAALRLMRGEVLDRPVLSSWAQVLDYCRAVPHPVPGQAQSNHRRRGAADRHRRPHPRLCARGGEAGAEAVGDVRRAMHNHPSGDPTPSRADIEMT
jgi:DNA repair protein RadC